MPSASNQRKPLPDSVQAGPRKKGLKPGQIHSGSFKKGYDPRRNVLGAWRNRLAIKQLEALAIEHAEDAIATLASQMNDKSAADNDRARAATALLDRAFGRPVDRVAIKQLGDTGGIGDVSGDSTANLLQAIKDRSEARLARAGGGPQVIDITPDSGPNDGE